MLRIHGLIPGKTDGMARSCNPATVGTRILDWGVSINWLCLKWIVSALALEAEWNQICEIPLALTTWNCCCWVVVQDTESFELLSELKGSQGKKGASQAIFCLPLMEKFKL